RAQDAAVSAAAAAHLDPTTWQKILQIVRTQHPSLNRSWFDQLAPRQLSNGVIQVNVNTPAQLNFCQGQCQQPFTQAAQVVLARQNDSRLLYLSCDSFINQFITAVQHGDMGQFRYRFRHVDVLVIDDIHFLRGHERTQEEFFHTFNTLYQGNKQIILSADAP